jgi:hypothetical protein
MGFVAVLQEQRTPIALYRNGNRALGSKVEFLLVLLYTAYFFWISWYLQRSK